MQITRCHDQASRALEEVYRGTTNPLTLGAAMLDLLDRLRSLPDDRRVFGLTSHYHLCLLAADTYRSPWFVKFLALDKQNYFVEYLMPKQLAPWPGAYVCGEARSAERAVQMILIAMEKSEGWSREQ